MARFLSPEWIVQLTGALERDEGLRRASAGRRLTVQQAVTGGPDGDLTWWLRLANGEVEAGPGLADGADVTVTEDYATATAVAQGRLTPAQAFAGGHIRLGGDVALLVRHQEAFAGVGRALASFRDGTTGP